MKKRLLLFCLLTFFLFLMVDANYYSDAIFDYTKLFIRNLFPFTFVIFVLSRLLFEFGLFEVFPTTLSILFLSMVSGFPSGSKFLAEQDYLKEKDANLLLRVCHFPNPFFVLGSISTVIEKDRCGFLLLILYGSSLVQVFLGGGLSLKKENYQNDNTDYFCAFQNALKDSILTILLIYGTSLFSYLIADEGIRIMKLHGISYSFFYGIFDLTKGIFSTTLLHQKRIREILILFFLSFGSISIHLQVIQILRDSKYQYSSFLRGRILGTILCFILYFTMLYS